MLIVKILVLLTRVLVVLVLLVMDHSAQVLDLDLT